VERHNILEYKCVNCGCDGNWQGGKISLEIDHENGDNTDNTIENLRYLCPNCHALTDTYRGKNKALKSVRRDCTPST
jgi:5-methylcytosine-specific restriction endonuclease McrA